MSESWHKRRVKVTREKGWSSRHKGEESRNSRRRQYIEEIRTTEKGLGWMVKSKVKLPSSRGKYWMSEKAFAERGPKMLKGFRREVGEQTREKAKEILREEHPEMLRKLSNGYEDIITRAPKVDQRRFEIHDRLDWGRHFKVNVQRPDPRPHQRVDLWSAQNDLIQHTADRLLASGKWGPHMRRIEDILREAGKAHFTSADRVISSIDRALSVAQSRGLH